MPKHEMVLDAQNLNLIKWITAEMQNPPVEEEKKTDDDIQQQDGEKQEELNQEETKETALTTQTNESNAMTETIKQK